MAEIKDGFDCGFVKEPPKIIQSECPVCLLVLREPYQATCCGYAFCRVCIEKVKVDNKPCPCCNSENFEKFEDKRLKLSLYEFRIRCSNQQQGCQWMGELGQLDNHLNYNPTEDKQLEGCLFSKIECLYCSDLFLRSYIQIHQSSQCLKRPFSCQYCEDFDSSYEDVTTNHWPVCGYYPLPCPNKCDEILQRQNLQSHITNDCPLTIIDCDFQHVGCEERLPRKDMPIHLQNSIMCHMSLHLEKSKHVMATASKLEEENKQLKKQIEKLNRDLETYKICTPFCPVELTMTNFDHKMKNEEKWQSPPFYSHLKGYKMCLYVVANGRGCFAGTHVSVYVILMKGKFDNQLKWPFRGEVEIQLLDHYQGDEQFKMKVDFASADIGPGNRVTEGELAQIKLGLPNFISHRILKPKNDCIRFYIKCSY